MDPACSHVWTGTNKILKAIVTVIFYLFLFSSRNHLLFSKQKSYLISYILLMILLLLHFCSFIQWIFSFYLFCFFGFVLFLFFTFTQNKYGLDFRVHFVVCHLLHNGNSILLWVENLASPLMKLWEVRGKRRQLLL